MEMKPASFLALVVCAPILLASSSALAGKTPKKKPTTAVAAPAPEEPPPAPPVAPETKAAETKPVELQPVPLASTPAGPAAVDKPVVPRPTKAIQPGNVDVWLGGSTDILLVYLAASAAVDIGVVPLGNAGTISFGAKLEYATCGSVCWFLDAVTPFTFGQHEIFPTARAAYHFPIKHKSLDLYGVLGGGPVFARSTIKYTGSTAVEYTGTDTGIGAYGGVGMHYFVADRFFLGAEGVLRRAAGTYRYEITSGQGDDKRTVTSGTGSTWSMSGLNLDLHAGVRF